MPSSLKFALKLVLGLALIAAIWTFIATQWGWKALPEPPAPMVSVFDTRFDAAGREAADRLDAMRQSYGVPGVTAAVAIDGELVWAAGAGWADVDTETPATPDTVFRIGSTSARLVITRSARVTTKGEKCPSGRVTGKKPFMSVR